MSPKSPAPYTITNLADAQLPSYYACLCPGEPELAGVADVKERWYKQQLARGFRVKVATADDGTPVGMLQYGPIEESGLDGQGLAFIYCVWIPPKKRLAGRDFRGKGVGGALLAAAEDDARASGFKGLAAWGLGLPFWMKASWFKRHGFHVVAKDGMMRLLMKSFSDDATPPAWRKGALPEFKLDAPKVQLTILTHGWCPAMNMMCQRARTEARALGDKVEITEIQTATPENQAVYGNADLLYIDGKMMPMAPPVAAKKIRARLVKAWKKRGA